MTLISDSKNITIEYGTYSIIIEHETPSVHANITILDEHKSTLSNITLNSNGILKSINRKDTSDTL